MAQHCPGLGHGSNSKETSVISILKIYLLIPFKNPFLLWYIFSSLVFLLDVSNTMIFKVLK